jgi:hypothetical protein
MKVNTAVVVRHCPHPSICNHLRLGKGPQAQEDCTMPTSVKMAVAICGASFCIAASPTRVADPMQFMHYLVGRWNCSSTTAGKTTTYKAQYAYALGGQWLRTINTSGSSSSEDMMTYANHRWMVVDMEPFRAASVLAGPDRGAARITLTTVYPPRGLTTTFNRVSFTKYTLTFGGTLNGKPAHWVDVCTKV